MQKPWTIATVGKGRREILSNTSLPSIRKALASSALASCVNSSMSAPAAKPLSLADRIASPLGGMPARWSAMLPSSRSASLEKVLVLVPARSKYSHARLSESVVSFQCLRSMSLSPPRRRGPNLLFLSDVQRLFDIGDDYALGIHDLHLEAGLVLVTRCRRLPRARDIGLVEAELGGDRAARGLEIP